MKASLIIKLIEAHCSGQESLFEKSLYELADHEEKKGNISLAQSLKNAYRKKNGNVSMGVAYNDPLKNCSYVTQAAPLKTVPRDRESLLELYEMLYPSVKLDDVILPAEQRNVIQQIIEEQKNAELLKKQGLEPVNRVLLCGPPGCGKTMTALAITHELSCPMAYVRLDGLVSSFLGQTSTNLRRVFDSIKGIRTVLFLDEFDAIAKKRDDPHELGELKRVVTTLLQNFDNMPDNIFLIAATNHQHLLDPAIWRRFNMAITLALPDIEQRKLLIKKWLTGYPVSNDFNIDLIAKLTEGLSCSQIEEIITITKKYVLVYCPSKRIQTEHIVDTFVKQMTLYSKNNSDVFWFKVKQLQQKGVSLRVLEKSLGIPKSTISDRLKEGESDERRGS